MLAHTILYTSLLSSLPSSLTRHGPPPPSQSQLVVLELSFTQQPLSQKVNKLNKVSTSFTSLFWRIEILFGTCHLDHTTDTTVTGKCHLCNFDQS